MNESETKALEAWRAKMEKRINDGPSFNTRQMGVILGTFALTLFAAGAWASSMREGLANNTAALVDIRADLKQLGEVAVLKAQVENLKSQINSMQIRLDAAGR